jgi:transcriptional regulator with GAF, ATPase, and Fis domain
MGVRCTAQWTQALCLCPQCRSTLWLETIGSVILGASLVIAMESSSASANKNTATDERVQFDARMTPHTVVQLRREEALYLEPQKLAAAGEPSSRIARDLQGLLKVITALNSIRGLTALERPLLELILDVLPAERAAIILQGSDLKSLSSVMAWDRVQHGAGIRLCKQIAEGALRRGIALLSNDVEDKAEGIERSVMAAPLVVFDRTLGLMYLDTQDRLVRFDTSHLQLCVTIAAIVGTVLENARYLESLESENERLRQEISLHHAMIGNSPPMTEVYQFIAKVARSDSTILLLGESGTGKELVARAIHQNSPRSRHPFVAINCAAITETLLESELFGYEKGAFTGADTQTRGKLEAAESGTVFLDEVGELAPPLQAKLLRVLQEHEFTRVGGTRSIKLDVRLVAATNRDLEAAARRGLFRQDLYYRLNVVSKQMPTLRERREDIPLLASHFLTKHVPKAGRRVTAISAEAERCLTNYQWPGNVRELENAIERALVLGSSEQVLPEDLPESVLEAASSDDSIAGEFHAAVREAKKKLILNAIARNRGSYVKAAKQLGLNPTYLHRLVRNLDLHEHIKQ